METCWFVGDVNLTHDGRCVGGRVDGEMGGGYGTVQMDYLSGIYWQNTSTKKIIHNVYDLYQERKLIQY